MFLNRQYAGLSLAEKLQEFKNRKDTIVLSIPRGGVVVGKQIADKLNLPFTAIVLKKLGAPGNPELAIGAIAPDGVKYIDFDLAFHIGVEQEYLDEEIKDKRKEVEERMKKYQISNIKYQIKDKKYIILIDDGIATGATTLAAIKYIKEVLGIRDQGSEIEIEEKLKFETYDPKPKIILAVPVIAKGTYNKLKSEVDKLVTLEISLSFEAVGQFYKEFPQVSDEKVIKLLKS